MTSTVIPVGVPEERTGAARRIVRRFVRRILRVPLVHKLIGANVLIIAAAILVQTVAFRGRSGIEVITAAVALTLATVMNLFLVRVALSPVEELEHIAERVSGGEFDARVTPSPFADKDLSHLGTTVNCLLDSLAAERKRIQDLGADVVHAENAERAVVSRELHDSIAQTLAAVKFQLAAAGREQNVSDIRNQLAAANSLVSMAMDQVVKVSYSLHSRVAEELGLEAALGTLARQVSDRSGIAIDLNVAACAPAIPPDVSATLFKVAEEALRDIGMHSAVKSAKVNVSAGEESIRIEVTRDDGGLGMMQTGDTGKSGLALVKDRVLLAGGKMMIDRTPSGGSRVIAEMHTMKAAS
jgi:signal transduction histidine kinase